MVDKIFQEQFYKKIKKWLIKSKVLEQSVPVIKSEFKNFINKNLRPVDRTILFNELVITMSGNLTEDGLSMLVRLETWAFEK